MKIKWKDIPQKGWYYKWRGNGYGPFPSAGDAHKEARAKRRVSPLGDVYLHYLEIRVTSA